MSKAYWNSDVEMLIDEEELECWLKNDAPQSYKKFCEWWRQRNAEFKIEMPEPNFEKYCETHNYEYKTPYKELNERQEIITAMHELIRSLNNEGAYFSHWIYLVPDGATEEDLIDMADNDEEFDEVCRLFNRLIARYGKYGYCLTDGTKAWGGKDDEDDEEEEDE